MIFHTDNKAMYTCKWCNKPFNDSLQLTHHVTQKHDNLNDAGSVAQCIICQKEFTNAPTLLFHLREHVEKGEQSK